jgi:competence protein ComEC
VATPTIMHHTGLVSPLAPVTTLVVMPLVSLALWIGYLVLMAGAALPWTAAWAGGALGWLGDTMVRWVMTLDDLPGMSVRLPAISALWSAAATALVVYWFVRGHSRDAKAWVATALVAGWLAAQLVLGPRLPGRAALRIDTLAVGDGTCHLVRSGADAMLWDCGSSRSGAGLREIPEAARSLGAWRVPTVVVTHANLDHFVALLDVVEPLGVRRLLVTRAFIDEGAAHPRGATAALLTGLRDLGVEVVATGAGDSLALGQAELRFLSPPEGVQFEEVNDTSQVGLFCVSTEAGPRRALFTGDIAAGAIAILTAGGAAPAADIMEVPHHGSARAAAMELLGGVNPTVVLQSTGPSRAGDPRWEHLREGRRWHTTATDGALWAEIGSDGAVRSGGLRR